MNIDVYDTYANSKQGNTIHFDVFVRSGSSSDNAYLHAVDFLNSIGEDGSTLEQSRCNFCHSEIANPNVVENIEKQNHFILQMEGCPNPFR